MIRLGNIPTIRVLLLTCMLGMTLSSCASDGRLDLKKLDFSKLKQPDWLSWDMEKAPPAPPQSEVQTAAATPAASDAEAAARPAQRPSASPVSATAHGIPRPKPWRPGPVQTPTQRAPVRQPQVAAIKEQPAKAPQGKVTSEIPKALAALPTPGKSSGTGGYSTNDLVGLDGPSVERLLGKPDLSRKEPFAEVWQYAHGNCVLFLFIYTQDKDVARVSHVETGARDGGDTPEPGQCIGAILARNAATPG